MRPTFTQTVNVLVQAYLNDSLRHGSCDACAVGNLIDYRRPLTIKEKKLMRDHTAGWNKVFCTFNYKKGQEIHEVNYNGLAKKQIESTGYHWRELAQIEFAFERHRFDNGDAMFNGLMAVVDVLAEIHKVDLSVKENAKLLFVR